MASTSAPPTPGWMKTRLTEAGMRPISLAVDVTNYVMLGLGQPLHAFDLARLGESIVVRRARTGERMTTLDDVDRALSPEDLLITDSGQTPIIAGVMGGESTEVSSTTDVLIEAAHFDAVSIARSARRHKLPSEASAASSGSRSRARPRGCTVGGRSARALWRRDGRRRRHRRGGGARVVDHSDGRRLPDPARRRRLRPHHRVPNNPHRIIRALEVIEQTGVTYSSLRKE